MSEFGGHRARKRFGQNFLRDPGVVNQILRGIHAAETDHVVEIGPGQGAITAGLVGIAERLDLIELDRDLIPHLLLHFGHKANVSIHQADALKFDFASLHKGKPLRVVGNLPYNISTPLMFRLLEQKELIADMHFMLQKEVVQRLCAEPGSKHWGRLGIMMQYHCDTESLFDVPPQAFSPAPKVQSAVVRLRPHARIASPVSDLNHFQTLITSAFNKRRKTLRNALADFVTSDEISSLDIDPTARPERLTLQEFIDLANLSTPQAR